MAPDYLPTPLTPPSKALLLPSLSQTPGTRVFALTVHLPGAFFSWVPKRPALSSPSGSPCLKVSSLIWSHHPIPWLPISVRMGPCKSVPSLKDSCVKFSSNWHHISHLFPWCFNAAYGLVLWAAAQITHPLVWFNLSHSTINVTVNVSQKHYASFTNPTTEGFNRLFYWFINFF